MRLEDRENKHRPPPPEQSWLLQPPIYDPPPPTTPPTYPGQAAENNIHQGDVKILVTTSPMTNPAGNSSA